MLFILFLLSLVFGIFAMYKAYDFKTNPNDGLVEIGKPNFKYISATIILLVISGCFLTLAYVA